MDKKELLDFIDNRIKYNHEQGIKYQNAECELVLIREEIDEVYPQPNYKELWNRLYNAQKDIAKNGDSKEKRYLAKGQVKLMDDLVKELDL